MDLLEYQAKKLFDRVGIPILPSQIIRHPRELKQLQILYPVVLKSQVRTGGRGKAGGIKFVNNTIDAIAAATTIFNLSILGEYPEIILTESVYETEREFFLAIVLDYQIQRPVILGSINGGMDVALLLDSLHKVVVENSFSDFIARRLASRMGLSGELLLSVSNIIKKMYFLFEEKDLDSIEINPLGINTKGDLMALDGKITINNNSLGRHPEFINLDNFLSSDLSFTTKDNINMIPTNGFSYNWHNKTGNIAILTNYSDFILLCWDLIYQKNIKAACSKVVNYNLGEERDLFCHKISDAISELKQYEQLNVLFINMFISHDFQDLLANFLFDYCQSNFEANNYFINLVVRLPKGEIERYDREFKSNYIDWVEDLDEAISLVIEKSS